MITPKFLKTGDTIGIISTARKISAESLQIAIQTFQSWGLNVVLGNNINAEYNQFAGTDEERAIDLQSMLDNSNINAIVCARGGYGTVRIIDKLDFTQFVHNPKWIAGYSDVTVLHSHIHQNFGIKTLHATMPLDFLENGTVSPSIESLKRALFGESISYKFNNNILNRCGEAEGIIVGGNLSILYSLRGTVSDIDTNGKILFLEDLDEYLYHIDRMMMNLKRGGKLDNLNGLIIGGMTDMHDNSIPYGKTVEEIILDAVKEYNYPVCFNVPAGHIGINNQALILGEHIKLSVTTDGSTLN